MKTLNLAMVFMLALAVPALAQGSPDGAGVLVNRDKARPAPASRNADSPGQYLGPTLIGTIISASRAYGRQ